MSCALWSVPTLHCGNTNYSPLCVGFWTCLVCYFPVVFFLTLQSFPLRMYRSVLIQRFKETPPPPPPLSSLDLSLSFSLCACPFSLAGCFTNFSHIDLLKPWYPSIQLSEITVLCFALPVPELPSGNCLQEVCWDNHSAHLICFFSFRAQSCAVCFPMSENICFSLSLPPPFGIFSLFLMVIGKILKLFNPSWAEAEVPCHVF